VTPEAYCEAVEAALARWPGAPLLRSAEEGRVVLAWCDEGIPLRVVLEVLGELERRRAAKLRAAGARGTEAHWRLWRPLAYADPAVRAAWEELQELVAPALRESAVDAQGWTGPRTKVTREHALEVLRWVEERS
jgi:hypothetical protein